jgi:tetratricopeptide (TPR) repeat protein
LQAESDGREAAGKSDLVSALAALKRATTLDPKFARAWIELGFFYEASRQQNSAVESFHKAVDAEPKQAIAYKILAFALAEMRRRSEAIEVWQKLATVAPDDHDVAWNLASLYMSDKRYKEAIPELETATKANPYNAMLMVSLGKAKLQSGDTEQGMAAMKKALEIDSSPEIFNDVAYEMAEADTGLPDALAYSQRSLQSLEETSRKIDLENVQPEDLRLPMAIGAYWDTLGWVYYKMGNFVSAEEYLNAAWQLRQDGVVGDHLGQVYEKEKKLSAALHMYSLALEASPKLEDPPARMRALAEKHVPLPKNSMSAGEELSRMRSFNLQKKLVPGNASADFYVLIGSRGKVEKASFLRGSELFRYSGDDLVKASVKVPFPKDSTVVVLRRGILSCSTYTGCSFVFYPAEFTATGR